MGQNDNEKEAGLPKAAVIAFVVVVIAVVVFVVMGQKRDFEPVKPGTESIDFTLPDLKGNPVSLKDYRGKVVFLNFWATWCQPCKDEMPSMQALYKSLQGQPFEILALSVDKDGPEVVEAFTKKYNVTFKVLHDRKGTMKEAYKTTGVPETFIIDQNGVIAEKVWGPKDWSDDYSTIMIKDLLANGPRKPGDYKTSKE